VLHLDICVGLGGFFRFLSLSARWDHGEGFSMYAGGIRPRYESRQYLPSFLNKLRTFVDSKRNSNPDMCGSSLTEDLNKTKIPGSEHSKSQEHKTEKLIHPIYLT